MFFCDQLGCTYKSKLVSTLKKHKSNIHDIGVVWHYCDQLNCDFKCKEMWSLNRHKSNVHDIDVVWHHCDQVNCNYKCKEAGQLKTHKSHIHDIGVVWHHCDQLDCDFKCKEAGNLKHHKSHVHDVGVMWHYCHQLNCDFKCKEAGLLKSHKSNVHDIGVVWHHCDQVNCNYKCKQAGHLKHHKSHVHDIGVVWHHCDQVNCNYKCKDASSLKTHKRHGHDIGVVWHHCDQLNCDFKCKQKGYIKTHKAFIHDIGKFTCEACIGKCAVLHEFNNAKMCRSCFRKATGKNTRIEKDMSDFLDEHFTPCVSADKSMRSLGGCSLKRPDKLYVVFRPNGRPMYIIVECDENQHWFVNGNYSCDEARLTEIFDEFENVERFVVVRWNPHAFEGGKVSKKDRLNALLNLLKNICESPPDPIQFIYYMYYDESNPLLAKNIPYKMLGASK